MSKSQLNVPPSPFMLKRNNGVVKHKLVTPQRAPSSEIHRLPLKVITTPPNHLPPKSSTSKLTTNQPLNVQKIVSVPTPSDKAIISRPSAKVVSSNKSSGLTPPTSKDVVPVVTSSPVLVPVRVHVPVLTQAPVESAMNVSSLAKPHSRESESESHSNLSPRYEFVEYYQITEGNQIQPKSNHLYVRGTGHVVGKHCSHIYLDGFGHHVNNNIRYSSAMGSHGLITNSGETVMATPFEVGGVKKIGKAQSSVLHLIATVNDRGIAHLINPHEEDRPLITTIRLPLSNSAAFFQLRFIVRGTEGKLATGTATNTVKVSENGATEWYRSNFTLTTDYNNLPAPFEIIGLNLNRFSNSTTISISNGEGNGELEVFVKVEILPLAA